MTQNIKQLMQRQQFHCIPYAITFLILIGLHSATETCHSSDCGLKCMQRHYFGGVCDETNCQCFYTPNKSQEDVYLRFNLYLLRCPRHRHDCDRLCRYFRFSMGYCDGEICECVAAGTNNKKEWTLPKKAFGCPGDENTCTKECQAIDFNTGACSGNRCVCNKYYPSGGSFTSEIACKPTQMDKCSLSCRSKYQTSYGYCKDTYCECVNKTRGVGLFIPESNLCPGNHQGCGLICVGALSSASVYGYCDNTTCSCFLKPPLRTYPVVIPKSEFGCPGSNIKCKSNCKMQSFTTGFCQDTECVCLSKPRYSLPWFLPPRRIFGCPVQENEPTRCLSECISGGYLSGECNGNTCHCGRTPNTWEQIS